MSERQKGEGYQWRCLLGVFVAVVTPTVLGVLFIEPHGYMAGAFASFGVAILLSLSPAVKCT